MILATFANQAAKESRSTTTTKLRCVEGKKNSRSQFLGKMKF